MKVYLEEKDMPKDCVNCDFGYANNFCEIDYELDLRKFDKNQKHPKCPLQSLADYTKQVRKEVIGQVRDIARKIARPTTEYDGGEFDYDIDGVTLDNLLMWLEDEELDLLKNFLDQIQGETKC